MKFIFAHILSVWCEGGGGVRYSGVSAAEPIKTSTAHYFACFSFDNNAGIGTKNTRAHQSRGLAFF